MGIVKVMVDGENRDFVTSLEEEMIEENIYDIENNEIDASSDDGDKDNIEIDNYNEEDEIVNDDTLELDWIIDEINKDSEING